MKELTLSFCVPLKRPLTSEEAAMFARTCMTLFDAMKGITQMSVSLKTCKATSKQVQTVIGQHTEID